jgi:hypothetical protein
MNEGPQCSIEGCENKARVRGFCNTHYTRWRRHGNPLGGRPRNKDGEGCLRPTGYILTQKNKRRVANHVRIAEEAIGKELPTGSIVHHINGNRSDNRPSNLIICQDEAYHHLIHLRTNATRNGFPPHYRSCRYCKQYDDPANMKECRGSFRHNACRNAYEKEKRESHG